MILILGNEASRATKNSITSAFSSIFRSKKSHSTSSNPNSPINNSSMTSTTLGSMSSSTRSSISTLPPDDALSRFGPDVRGYAMAAVILEEWLQELAAIAQEQSVLRKEIAFHVGMALDHQGAVPPASNPPTSGSVSASENSAATIPPAKKNSSAIIDHTVVIRANNFETSMS